METARFLLILRPIWLVIDWRAVDHPRNAEKIT
jgi:hypothetical protein